LLKEMSEHYGRHQRPTVELIRTLAANRAVYISEHAYEAMKSRGISSRQLRLALSHNVEIVADYKDDPRGHSAKVLCQAPTGKKFSAVCACVEMMRGLQLIVITVYQP